jgi:hypothetical protein
VLVVLLQAWAPRPSLQNQKRHLQDRRQHLRSECQLKQRQQQQQAQLRLLNTGHDDHAMVLLLSTASHALARHMGSLSLY